MYSDCVPSSANHTVCSVCVYWRGNYSRCSVGLWERTYGIIYCATVIEYHTAENCYTKSKHERQVCEQWEKVRTQDVSLTYSRPMLLNQSHHQLSSMESFVHIISTVFVQDCLSDQQKQFI